MPKQVIIIMEENYPFGQCQECTNEKTRVLVRKIYRVGYQQRSKLLQKVSILRRLKNQHMIRVQSVLQEEQSVHFLFEYIPIKLQTWISNINDQFIQNFRDQLIKFSSFLANNFIKIEFQLKNIGMDQNYGAKYFLDLDFEVDQSVNREKLKSNYIREITNLFRPYLTPQSQALHSDRPNSQFKAQQTLKASPQPQKARDSAISPPTNKQNNSSNKNKEKALEHYYQQVNMSVDSENEKILKQFIDVLNSDEQQESKPNHNFKNNQKPSPQLFQKPNPPPQKEKQPQSFPQQQQQNVPFQNSQKTSSIQKQSNQQQQNYQFQSNQQLQTADYKTNGSTTQFQSQNASEVGNPAARNMNSSQSMGRGRSQIKQAVQSDVWRQSADLQNRVKTAIEKSMNVIKKFKAIKDTTMG